MRRYLHHVTLTTGHTRRSWRHELDPAVMPIVAALLRSARDPRGAPIHDTDCRLYVDESSRCLLASVGDVYGVPILAFAVAAHSRCGAALWRVLHDTARTPLATDREHKPAEPWLAVRFDAAAALHAPPDPLLPMLADVVRCVAWAWLDEDRA